MTISSLSARKESGRAYGLVEIHLPVADEPVNAQTFTFSLHRKKLRQVRRREGHYLLRSNLCGDDPAKLWEYYIRLTEVEQAFKELKSDLAVRPIFYQRGELIFRFALYCYSLFA
jgi:hypothetical protein